MTKRSAIPFRAARSAIASSRSRRRRDALAACCLLAVLAAGCGGDDEPPPYLRRGATAPTPSQLLERGRQALRAGEIDEARGLLEQIPAGSPQRARALNLIGMIQVSSDSLRTARRTFKAALDEDAELAMAHNNLGALYLLERRASLAEVAFELAAKLDDSYPEPIESGALLLLREGRVASARSELARAARIRRRVPAEQLQARHVASVQSLDVWPWKNVARRVAAEERRRAAEAARADSARADSARTDSARIDSMQLDPAGTDGHDPR